MSPIRLLLPSKGTVCMLRLKNLPKLTFVLLPNILARRYGLEVTLLIDNS